MDPLCIPEDPVRILSQLVFACIPPGKTTLKLHDPVTGALGDYQLVKTSPSVASYLKDTWTSPQSGLLSQAHSADIAHRLKADGPEDSCVSDSRFARACTSTPCYVHSPGFPRVSARGLLACSTPLGPNYDDTHMHDTPGPFVCRLPRKAGYIEARGASTLTPLIPQGPWHGDTPSLLYDADTSGTSSRPLPTRTKLVSSRITRRDSTSTNASADTSGSIVSPSPLVGLGFSMVNNDGSTFNGLGVLPRNTYSNVPSPTDEARARAHQRRACLPTSNRHSDDIARYTNEPAKPPKTVRISSVARVAQYDFDTPHQSKVSTPVSIPPRNLPTPAAPLRRVVSRLPVEFAKDRKTLSRRSVATVPTRQSPTYASGSDTGKLKRARGSSLIQTQVKAPRIDARRTSDSTSRRSSAIEGMAMGDELRFWSTWMTPVSERDVRSKAAWRP